MRTQLKVSFGDQEIAREALISMNAEFIAENFLRCPECDCLCLALVNKNWTQKFKNNSWNLEYHTVPSKI